MLWGGVGAGKTTLLHALADDGLAARKTQMIDFVGWAIDTPGEYAERVGFRGNLVATASQAQLLVVVQDATRANAHFPPHYFRIFTKPIIGVVTKIDMPTADVERAGALLRAAGVSGQIFPISAITGSGLSTLRQSLLSSSSAWKE